MKTVFENESMIISVDDNAFVEFKGVGENEISENYCADAEIAVQEWLDSCEDEDYANCEAGASYVYKEEDGCGICVNLHYS